MDFYDVIYKQYQEDLKNKVTNLTWDEYLYYVLNNQNGVCVL